MQLLELTPEQLKLAKEAVASRFVNNSVAYQSIPLDYIKKNETTIRWDRYDYDRKRVVDNEMLTLLEPIAEINLSRSQKDEQDMRRALTTTHRQTSELARLFDALAFVGVEEAINRKIAAVEIPTQIQKQNKFISLREAAIMVEEDEGAGPILVEPYDSQESLVSAGFKAVFCLEKYGYYSNYFSIWGERIWSLLNKPEQHDSVRPKEILQDTIQDFYRSTTLNPDEALVASLDGPTMKYVIASREDNMGSMEGNMNMAGAMANEEVIFFEPYIIEPDDHNEHIYKYKVRFRAVPCVQEVRSIVRIKLASSDCPEK